MCNACDLQLDWTVNGEEKDAGTNRTRKTAKPARRRRRQVEATQDNCNSANEDTGSQGKAEVGQVGPMHLRKHTEARTRLPRKNSEKFGTEIKHADIDIDQKSRCQSLRHVQEKVVYHHFGTDAMNLLNVETADIPQPEAPNHVVVKIHASTVSLDDCILRRGFCFDVTSPISLPVTPGMDFVGKVVACGSQVDDFKNGEWVAGLVRTGGNARFISVAQCSLVPVPKMLDSAEAVCMVSTYTAAYQTMRVVADRNTVFSMQGKKVLIVGGMHNVGQALIELCTKAKAEIFATAPDRRHSYIRNMLGATPLPESASEWSTIVDGEMDYVLDGVCEDGLVPALQALKQNGKLACFGHSSILREEMGLFGTPLSARFNRWRGDFVSGGKRIDLWESHQADPELYKIRPHIAKRVMLSDVAAVHARLENGDIRGIVVCQPWKTSRPGAFQKSNLEEEN
ncbi:predicted protein [Phaeodactylum tricornutum CCAP 1055/1]|uniref:Enoyl reductase (ER) domain-containing protein n=4 Tax=Phaeodactylum tricornutum TaxID=2850 RepID=B7G438_PHATC|nr:predicted protein [Phaeodactylum tricornutum CCAP 1055/1]EEC46389.1 predicted protein [Phaeodactylum tricornutum CCAP 1055/1]|eukprot:XP_002181849.1 predicted protein [Phaeodactylum tricornutum CCAP 1055/1]